MGRIAFQTATLALVGGFIGLAWVASRSEYPDPRLDRLQNDNAFFLEMVTGFAKGALSLVPLALVAEGIDVLLGNRR